MKKSIAIMIGVGLAGLLAFAGGNAYKPVAVEVGPSSTLIVPAAGQAATNAWSASKVVAKEEIIYTPGNYFYWVTVAGTCETNVPTHYDGDHTNGTATLRFIHKDRSKVILTSADTNIIWLAFGNAAEKEKGLALRASNANQVETDFQGAIYGISPATTTNTAAIHEE